MAEQQESPNIDDLTPEEASRIIHSHRKVRYGTSIFIHLVLRTPSTTRAATMYTSHYISVHSRPPPCL